MAETETSHLLLRTTATKMCYDIQDRLDDEWHSGDEYDRLVAKLNRLDRFKEYVKLHREFN